jgi:hypothetical protein
VSQVPADWSERPEPAVPYFEGPIPFVVAPDDPTEPFYSHNHGPSVTWLENGDLLVVWFSTEREANPESTILASRLRNGHASWEPASEFFKAPFQGMSGPGIWHDGNGTLLQYSALFPKVGDPWWRALLLRKSYDNGVTWTRAEPFSTGDRYVNGHRCGPNLSQLSNGTLVLVCDVSYQGSSTIHLSDDGGSSWYMPGGLIRGIHARIVEIADGKLLAFARHHGVASARSEYRWNEGTDLPLMNVESLGELRMPMSITTSRGLQWDFKASPFPPIGSGQRLELIRLREGPLLLISFTSKRKADLDDLDGFPMVDGSGQAVVGYGMFAALSWDDGETWPVKKLVTPGSGEYDGGAWTGPFTATPTRAEHAGYLSATQTPDGVIHLLSSRLHYRFNLTWLLDGREHQELNTR